MPHVLDFLERLGRNTLLLMRTTQPIPGARAGAQKALGVARTYMRMSSGPTIEVEGTDDRCVVRQQWINMLAKILEYDDAHPDKRILEDHHVSAQELQRLLATDPEPLVGVSPMGMIQPSSSRNAELLRRAETYLDERLAERDLMHCIDPEGDGAESKNESTKQ